MSLIGIGTGSRVIGVSTRAFVPTARSNIGTVGDDAGRGATATRVISIASEMFGSLYMAEVLLAHGPPFFLLIFLFFQGNSVVIWNNKLTQGRHAAGTEGGGTDGCDVVVATDPFRTVPEVAVPGLLLDTAGELLLEVPLQCGASGEKGSIVGNPYG